MISSPSSSLSRVWGTFCQNNLARSSSGPIPGKGIADVHPELRKKVVW
jgi:hypothetical protein